MLAPLSRGGGLDSPSVLLPGLASALGGLAEIAALAHHWARPIPEGPQNSDTLRVVVGVDSVTSSSRFRAVMVGQSSNSGSSGVSSPSMTGKALKCIWVGREPGTSCPR